MSSLTPFVISGYESGGLEQDKKPFLLPDKAFQQLENAYVWRDRVKKREGLKLVGRLERRFEEYSFSKTSVSPWTFNPLTISGYVRFATRENPGVITTTYPHGLSNNDLVTFSKVLGMTELNGVEYTITVLSPTSFSLGVDTTGYTSYSSGGVWIAVGPGNATLPITDEPNAELAPGTFLLSTTTNEYTDYIKMGAITNVTSANPGVVTSANHRLSTGDIITINQVVGMTQLNGNTYQVTVLTANTFSINADTSDLISFSPYVSGGTWSTQFAKGNGTIFGYTFGDIALISNAPNALVTTVNPHNLLTGDIVYLQGVQGMTQVNNLSYTITFVGANQFLLNVDSSAYGADTPLTGTWTSPLSTDTGLVNYGSGVVTLTHTLGAGVSTFISYGYYPSLPCMGIPTREVVGINDEQTLFFDTKYCYVNTGSTFQEFIPGTIWTGTDAQFFWATNYRGVEPSSRLMFVTNFNIDPGDPIRYTDGTTWTDFRPALAGTTVLAEIVGNTAAPFLTFNGNLVSFPVEPGTVTITVGTVVFSDATSKNGKLVGNPSINTGIIDYETGAFTLSFNPALVAITAVKADYVKATNTLYQARIIIPYFGRLLAGNVFEGPTYNAAKTNNIFNRERFSQIGNPIQSSEPANPQLIGGAWRTDVRGKGGFIDAPVNEIMVSTAFFKNTLIVGFERSTWQLRYVGEYGLPFLWDRISSDFGTESTFSTVLFDDGVLSAGDKAFTSASSNTVQRIDSQIPDLIFTVRNAQDGPERVQGIRDFQRELVFWNYSDAGAQKTYPNTVLVFNYRNQTYAKFRDNVTAFGTLQLLDNITWDRFDIFWDDEEVFWDDVDSQSKFPSIVCGNQQGFISFYGYTSIDEPSLSISAVDMTTTPVKLTVYNHNFDPSEFIKVTGMQFLNGTSPVGSALNNVIYQVTVIDINTIGLQILGADVSAPLAEQSYTYVGNGQIISLPRLFVQTKDFNPYMQSGLQLKLAYIDFLTDCTPNLVMSVELYLNASQSLKGNLLVGNKQVETYLKNPYWATNTNNDPISQYSWHRFYATAAAQFINIAMTFDDELMYLEDTHKQDWTLNAMTLYARPGGKNVF